MFEKYTFEYHIDDMLARVLDEFDKREGSPTTRHRKYKS